MEEHTITVDGETHALPAPFICIATQNPLGSAGTQPLLQSQIDRFMVSLSIGRKRRWIAFSCACPSATRHSKTR